MHITVPETFVLISLAIGVGILIGRMWQRLADINATNDLWCSAFEEGAIWNAEKGLGE